MNIAFYTLGCKVNQYETQLMTEQFRAAGYHTVDAEEAADIYVVNTCTVTRMADRKSRQYIRRMKRKNPDCVTVVLGCYSQISPEEVQAMPEVDLICGTNEKGRVVDYVERFLQDRVRRSYVLPREQMTEYDETGSITSVESRTRAIIKIQEGCDRFCSYCVIPYARGPVRSRAPQDVVKEAEHLLKQGFKELVLAGINTALYGKEAGFQERYRKVLIDPETGTIPEGVEGILRLLNALPGDFRIRLSSLEPTVVDRNEAERLLRYEKLCHHLHLSLQSGSDRILRTMNRRYDRNEYLEIVTALRTQDPGYGISTDMIVGFPGEREEEFQDSLDVVERVQYCKVHVFPYSRRPGTPAAEFPEQISPELKKMRGRILTACAEAASKQFFSRNCGQVRRVLFEEYEEERGLLTGYTDNYIKVYVSGDPGFCNRFAEVKLEETFEDGMRGTVLDKF